MNHLSTFLDTSFEEAVTQVTEALKKEGMGVLTEIDIQATLKKKIDVNFRKYRILGACHPVIAHQMCKRMTKQESFILVMSLFRNMKMERWKYQQSIP